LYFNEEGTRSASMFVNNIETRICGCQINL
jgi:hypothetical protein